MDHIGRPVLRRNIFYTLIDCLLQRNYTSVEVIGDTVNRFNKRAKMSKHRVVIIIAEHKRLAYHKSAVTFLCRKCEKLPVGSFVFVKHNCVRQFVFGVELVPDVVNADEDAEDIGVVVEAIFLPAAFEVCNGVAGDSGVDDIQVVSGIFCQEGIRHKVDVAEAEGLVGTMVSVGVGNAVADEKNFVIRF